jgi:hypothetical protein
MNSPALFFPRFFCHFLRGYPQALFYAHAYAAAPLSLSYVAQSAPDMLIMFAAGNQGNRPFASA